MIDSVAITPAPLLLDVRQTGIPCLALRAREAAKALGISERTLFDLTRKGLPCVRLDRAVLYPVDSLRAWLTSQAAQAAGGTVETSMPQPENVPPAVSQAQEVQQ
jgi:predicted DNA-binding transcriptional regulator AlpA